MRFHPHQNLIKIFYLVIRSKKILISLTVFLIMLIFLPLLIYQLTAADTRAAILRNYPVTVKILPLYWRVRKISDILYLPYYFKKNTLPGYELIISPDNQQKLTASLPSAFMNVTLTDNVFVPAEFKFDNEKYKVKVRYRGVNAIHWNAPKKSYLIRFDQDKPFQGYRELSFILPNDRNFALEHLNNYRAEKLGVLHPPSFFANLKVNGQKNALYFVIENWDEEMIAKWQVPDASNFYANAGSQVGGYGGQDDLWDSVEYWKLLTTDDRYTYKHYTELHQLLNLLRQASDQEFFDAVFNLINEDNLYHWQVMQELANANHHTTDNLRLYFNNSSGKFYFIPWDVGGGSDYAGEDHLDLYSELTARIFSNPRFLHKKNKILYDYAANPDNLKDDLAFYDDTFKAIQPALYQDRLKIFTNRFADKVYRDFRARLLAHYQKIQDDFGPVFVKSQVKLAGDNQQKFNGQHVLAAIDLSVQSLAGGYLKELIPVFTDDHKLNNYSLYYDANNDSELTSADRLMTDYRAALLFSRRVANPAGQSEKYVPVETKHTFFLLSRELTAAEFSANLKDIKLDVENSLSGQKISSANVSVKIINEAVFEYFNLISNIDEFVARNPIFTVNKITRQINLSPGVYRIAKTIIVPKDYTLRILPGATLIFSPKTSLISYSNILAEGTALAPINFIGVNNAAWGVVAVQSSPRENIFNYCNFSNGQDDYINGVYYSGMLSLYYSPAKISHSTFSFAHADDSLNIKNASAELAYNVFSNNRADAVDFDFIKNGFIKESQFINNGNDGIDLSGSSVLIENNYIEKSGDKCVSVGEQSLNAIIFNNILNNCNIGVEIKDLSEIKIINNVIANNKIGLNAYEKKPIFGGGRAEVYNSIFWRNEKNIEIDKKSAIAVYHSNLSADDDGHNNFDNEPIFIDGARGNFRLNYPKSDQLFSHGGHREILNNTLNLNSTAAPVGLVDY